MTLFESKRSRRRIAAVSFVILFILFLYCHFLFVANYRYSNRCIICIIIQFTAQFNIAFYFIKLPFGFIGSRQLAIKFSECNLLEISGEPRAPAIITICAVFPISNAVCVHCFRNFWRNASSSWKCSWRRRNEKRKERGWLSPSCRINSSR